METFHTCLTFGPIRLLNSFYLRAPCFTQSTLTRLGNNQILFLIEKFRMSRGLIKFHTRTKNWNKSEENLNRAKPRRLQIDRQRLKFEFEDVRFRRHSITAHFIIFQPVTLPTPMYLVALPRYIYLCSVWPYLYLPMYLVAIPTSTYVPCGPTYIYLCTVWHYLYLPMYIVVWLTSTYVPCGLTSSAYVPCGLTYYYVPWGLTYIYLCTFWPYLSLCALMVKTPNLVAFVSHLELGFAFNWNVLISVTALLHLNTFCQFLSGPKYYQRRRP